MANFTSRFFTTLQRAALFTKAGTQHRHIRNGQSGVVADDHHAGAGEDAFQRLHRFGLLSTIHCGLLSWATGQSDAPSKRTRTSRSADKTPERRAVHAQPVPGAGLRERP